MNEKTLENKVCVYARDKGVLAYKFGSPGRRGVPDRMFLYKGKTLFIEFKAEDGKLSALQLHQAQLISDQGFEVRVCDNVLAGKRMVQGFINDAIT